MQYKRPASPTPSTSAPEEPHYQEAWAAAPAAPAPAAAPAPTRQPGIIIAGQKKQQRAPAPAPVAPVAPAPRRNPEIIVAGQKKPEPPRQYSDAVRDYFNPPQFQGRRAEPRAPPMSKRAMSSGTFETSSGVRAVVYHRGERVGAGRQYSEEYSEYSP